MNKQIIFEIGDIAFVSKNIYWAANNGPTTYREPPILFVENFCRNVFYEGDPVPFHFNRWKCLVGEKNELLSWPNNAYELLEDYCIEVYKTKTKTHETFLGKSKGNKGIIYAQSVWKDGKTGYFAFR